MRYTRNVVFVTTGLSDRKEDFSNAAKYGWFEDFPSFLDTLNQIRTGKLTEVTDRIGTDLDLRLRNLLAAGFPVHSDGDGYSVDLKKVMDVGVPITLIRDSHVPCDFVCIVEKPDDKAKDADKTFCYEFSCLCRELEKRLVCVTPGESRSFCWKDPEGTEYEFDDDVRPCDQLYDDERMLKILDELRKEHSLKEGIFPVYPYSFYLDRILWEDFFGMTTFQKRFDLNFQEMYPEMYSRMKQAETALRVTLEQK